ncbi:MAG: tetratricopeptide repeat protein [Pseudomonadota bacterium]
MIRLVRRAAAVALALIAAPAAADWREASTDHFLIYADAGEGWVKDYATRLERFASALQRLQPKGWAGGGSINRVVIYVLPSVEDVQALAGGRSVGGFYKPRIGSSVIFTPMGSRLSRDGLTPITTLQHEYTHHFLLSTARSGYPFWYSEGFAELFGTARVQPNGTVEIGHPAEHRAYNLFNGSMKIEQLFAPPKKFDGDVLYGRAWLLAHMLTFDPARSGQVERYVALINAGKPSLDAAREAFGDLNVLQKQMTAYASRQLTYSVMPADMTKVGPIALRTLTAGEAAMMPVRLRSDNGVTPETAGALVTDARRRAAPYPGDAGAQVALAEAEFDAGHLDEAAAAADRALAADPKSREAMLYKGRVLMQRAAAPDATDPKRWQEARRWFVRANRLEPDAPEPLALYYTSYLKAGEKPPEAAIVGLERAFELSPHAVELRMLVARQYLTEGDVKTARVVLSPLAIDHHGATDKGLARRMIEAIDAGRPASDVLATPAVVPDDSGAAAKS